MTCAQCAAPLTPRPPGRRGRRARFCSRVCRDQASGDRDRVRRHARLRHRCATCHAWTLRRDFCSRACRAAASRCACGARITPTSTRCRACEDARRRPTARPCHHCGVVFRPKKAKYATFCSRACAFADMHARRLTPDQRRARDRAADAARRVVRPPRPCAHCGTPFVPTRDGVRFCARRCSSRHHGARKRHTPRTFRCAVCREPVQAADKRRRFCSSACRRFATRRAPGLSDEQLHARWLYGQVYWFLIHRPGFEAHHGTGATPRALVETP
jgi:hypothetical protein